MSTRCNGCVGMAERNRRKAILGLAVGVSTGTFAVVLGCSFCSCSHRDRATTRPIIPFEQVNFDRAVRNIKSHRLYRSGAVSLTGGEFALSSTGRVLVEVRHDNSLQSAFFSSTDSTDVVAGYLYLEQPLRLPKRKHDCWVAIASEDPDGPELQVFVSARLASHWYKVDSMS